MFSCLSAKFLFSIHCTVFFLAYLWTLTCNWQKPKFCCYRNLFELYLLYGTLLWFRAWTEHKLNGNYSSKLTITILATTSQATDCIGLDDPPTYQWLINYCSHDIIAIDKRRKIPHSVLYLSTSYTLPRLPHAGLFWCSSKPLLFNENRAIKHVMMTSVHGPYLNKKFSEIGNFLQ